MTLTFVSIIHTNIYITSKVALVKRVPLLSSLFIPSEDLSQVN